MCYIIHEAAIKKIVTIKTKKKFNTYSTKAFIFDPFNFTINGCIWYSYRSLPSNLASILKIRCLQSVRLAAIQVWGVSQAVTVSRHNPEPMTQMTAICKVTANFYRLVTHGPAIYVYNYICIYVLHIEGTCVYIYIYKHTHTHTHTYISAGVFWHSESKPLATSLSVLVSYRGRCRVTG